jgi:Glycine cleavage system regulatory protein
MKTQLLVNAFGPDRPGIVARLSEIVSEHGANLEASRMALLGGEFAAITLVSVASERVKELEEALATLKNEGLTVICKQTQGAGPERFAGYSFYSISLSGADHEGIVHKLSSHLRDLKINILKAETDIVNAPETGSPLFTMNAEIAVPPSIGFDALCLDLSKIATELCVDIDLLSSSTWQAELVAV